MKRTITAFVLTAFLLGTVSLLMPAQPEPDVVDAESQPKPEPDVQVRLVPSMGVTLPCRVLSVHDGDTLKVECKFVMDIRLIDCWAPEITGDEKPKGLKSLANLKKLAYDKTGVVFIPLHENIGKATSMSRVLGRVYINGDDLSYMQVSKKFATKTKED